MSFNAIQEFFEFTVVTLLQLGYINFQTIKISVYFAKTINNRL